MPTSHVHSSLGFGLGLRPQHYEALLGEHRGSVAWLEALTENYLVPGGRPLHYLERLRAHYPVVLHGVSLSIGSTDPLNLDYLREREGARRSRSSPPGSPITCAGPASTASTCTT